MYINCVYNIIYTYHCRHRKWFGCIMVYIHIVPHYHIRVVRPPKRCSHAENRPHFNTERSKDNGKRVRNRLECPLVN